VLDLRTLEVPVIGAPMAGGPSTPSLVSAVSSAGGLGMLAGGYKTAAALASDVLAVRSATDAPFGVNLFVVEPFEPDPDALDDYGRSLRPEAARFGVELGVPRWDDDQWQDKLEVVLDLRPDVVSFTFGCPEREVLRRLASVGILSMLTVTSVGEAREAEARGAAALSVQGFDAGGHRGTWDPLDPPVRTHLVDLVAQIVTLVDVPVAGGGAIHDAAGVSALIGAGSVGAQVGTAYLLADEAGTNATHRAALRASRAEATALTRAYTGRWARGLANRFMSDHADAPAGYPHIHHLTAPLRASAIANGDREVAHLWAGSAHSEIRQASAAEITQSLTP
jgi:nitronate monooxygenase